MVDPSSDWEWRKATFDALADEHRGESLRGPDVARTVAGTLSTAQSKTLRRSEPAEFTVFIAWHGSHLGVFPKVAQAIGQKARIPTFLDELPPQVSQQRQSTRARQRHRTILSYETRGRDVQPATLPGHR